MYSKEYKELLELLKKLKEQLEEDKVLQEYYYFIKLEELKDDKILRIIQR